MPLVARLFNILATPGDVFTSLKTGPLAPGNWIVPGLLFVLISSVGGWLLFSQPAIRQQLTELTDKQIQKQIERTHLPPDKAEQMRSITEMIQKAAILLGPIVPAFGFIWLWGLIVWVVGHHVIGADFGYMKAVELIGLSNMIAVLGAVVRILLIILTGNLFASASLGLLIKNFDPQNPMHSLLALVNVFTLWHLAVRSIGLARLAGVTMVRAALWVFGIWIAYAGFFWGLGAAMQKLVRH